MSRQEKGRSRSPQRSSFNISQEDITVANFKNGMMQINAQDLRIWELVTNVP